MSNLNVSVLIKLIDELTSPVRRMAHKVTGQFKFIGSRIKKLNDSFRAIGQQVRSLTLKITATAGAATYAFKRLFVDSAAEFERYQVMLKSLEGSNDKARKAMAWVSDFATRAPLQLNELMQGYVKLKTFGLDPTNGTLQSLVDMNAKMGGSNETLQGMILAVGQAWTKQKLQGEEALQLIERGVPVWDLLAKATGLNVQQLQKLSEKGKLGRGAIRMLVEEIGKSSKGAASEQAKTWSGMTSMISDYWIRFSNMVMSNGVFDWMKGQLSGLLGRLDAMSKSGELQRFASELGTKILDGLKQLLEIGRGLWSILQSVGGVLKWLRDLFGSWTPVLAGIAAIILGPLMVSLLAGTKAIIGLGAALLTTPVGWFMAAIAAIVGLVVVIYKKWEPIKKFFGGLWDWIKETFNTGIEFLKKIFEHSPLGLLIKGIGKLQNIFSSRTSIAPSRSPVQALTQGVAHSQVGGLIRVKVEGDGRPRVAEMRTSGGIDMEVESGMSLSGAY